MDATIIYYTANVEDEEFARKIRNVIFENSGGLPIISVSRKPIDFGENICVGEKPVCVANAYRQIYTGLRAAQTRFALAVENDTLYPPEYFTFTPFDEDHFFRYSNIWAFYLWPTKRYGGRFWKKSSQMEGAQICGCKHWMQEISRVMDVGNWEDVVNPPIICDPIVRNEFTWRSDNPVLTCKTDKGLFRYTTRSIVPTNELPYWGTVEHVTKNLSKENQWTHWPTS